MRRKPAIIYGVSRFQYWRIQRKYGFGAVRFRASGLHASGSLHRSGALARTRSSTSQAVPVS